VVGLLIALVSLVALVAPVAPVTASSAPPPDPPPVTVSDFYPENADLSECLGFVQRPGCGSEARGGPGQTMAFLALAAGLAFVFWRVSVGVRKNRRS
jgi:MYXO-CTERM domain-containing protein